MFTYTAKLTDGRLVCLVTQQSDGTYAVASALPHADRNQAARNGFYALQAVSRGWIRKFSPETLAYIADLLAAQTMASNLQRLSDESYFGDTDQLYRT